MAKTLSLPSLAFRLYRTGGPWPFTAPTILRLPPGREGERWPKEWIGWTGKEAVALLSTYPAGTRECGIESTAGDEILFLRVAMDDDERFIFDPPTAYKFAFRHVLGNSAIYRIIVELPTSNRLENEYLASLDLAPFCEKESEPIINYYIINRNWETNPL
jgi:hypothetical protein